MPDFFLGNFAEALSRYSRTKSFRLSITLSKIHSVEVVLIVQTGFDEGFNGENRGRN
jgi:hypothetical protein